MNDDDEKLRRLDRKIRWTTFLYFNKFKWEDIIHEVYGLDIDSDSYEYMTARTKILDNVKAYKNRVLTQMKVMTMTNQYMLLTLRPL